MKTQAQILEREMHTLIENSCAAYPKMKTEPYGFQRALLKFYFGAADVIINYDKEKITLFTSSNDDVNNKALYQSNTTALVEISYLDLETTLKQCLEEGDKQERFYKSLLFHYNHVNEGLGAWSA